MKRSIYLGDGAYATITDEGMYPLILTTGSHDLEAASNRVFLEQLSVEKLKAFLDDPEIGDIVE